MFEYKRVEFHIILGSKNRKIGSYLGPKNLKIVKNPKKAKIGSNFEYRF